MLSQWDVVENNATLYGINKLVSLASNGIFNILPMAVCLLGLQALRRQTILGLVIGAIMLDGSLANAYDAAKGLVDVQSISLFGFNIELVGFQGGIIIALMMGFIIAKLDIFFDKKIPDVVKLLFSPMCSVLISTILLFTIVGPVGRLLSNGITNGLVWMTQNLGALGYMVFAGVQQIIVITGLHHILGAIEAQLLADPEIGRDFLNPLMSVALMGQGGAVLGYLVLNWKNNKMKELCIPSFISTLFGISEPAIFGVNLRYKFPLVAGCIGGACAGAYVYFSQADRHGLRHHGSARPGHLRPRQQRLCQLHHCPSDCAGHRPGADHRLRQGTGQEEGRCRQLRILCSNFNNNRLPGRVSRPGNRTIREELSWKIPTTAPRFSRPMLI